MMDAERAPHNIGTSLGGIAMLMLTNLAEYAVVLAHQGGWDEFLMVAAPIVVFAVLLRIANKRAKGLEADNGSARPGDGSARQSDPPSEPPPRPAARGPI